MPTNRKVIAVIPARWASTRFPGKPIADIHGKPMIQLVSEQAEKANLVNEVIIATDDKRIYDVVLGFGGKAIMTSQNHRSGTDRVAEVAKNMECDIVVNVQGDEPLIPPENIDLVVKPLLESGDLSVSTLMIAIKDWTEWLNPDVCKVVVDNAGYALYFSRAPIPYSRDIANIDNPKNKNGIDVDSNNSLDNFLMLQNSGLDLDFKVVTPITSVASFLEGTDSINAILGIDPSIDINITDPIATMNDDDAHKFLYEKGSQITVLVFSLQSALNYINVLQESSETYFESVQKVIEDHGIEASISKVVGSEALAYNVDEGVQIYGGAGFIEEYPMASIYRDERINRIFEGTNEINRLIIGNTVLKKSILEEIPIRDMIAQRAINWLPDLNLPSEESLVAEARAVEYSRSLVLYCLHESILKYGQDLKNEQWIIEPLANMVIEVSVMDTCYKRYMQIEDGQHKDETRDVLMLSVADQFQACHKNGLDIIEELFPGGERTEKITLINEWYNKTGYLPRRIEYQKRIADTLYKHNKYYLD